MFMKFYSLTIVLAIGLQACAVRQPPLTLSIKPDAAGCEGFFRDMDDRIAASDAADAGAARIADFPGLRTDRFLASFNGAALTEHAYADWLERLRRLDEAARLVEWRNLPNQAKSTLPLLTEQEVAEKVSQCGQILKAQVLNSSNKRLLLRSKLQPPDAYSSWRRVFGLYFLTRWAIVGGVFQLHREMRAPFLNTSRAQSARGRMMNYAPPDSPAMRAEEVADILARSAANPLAIPEPSASQLEQLFAAYAPVWRIDTLSDNDRIGTVEIAVDGEARIDIQQPTVYRLPSYTRFGNQVLLQLNYSVWFPARPAKGLLDIYAGQFDGLIWRVTLRMDGRPLAYDSIHPCGCYYQIFPGEGMRVAQPLDGSEPILTPAPILTRQPGQRVAVKIAAENHFINGIASQQATVAVKKYHWQDYDTLRSLPISNDGHLSLFDEDGFLPGSERTERFLLWPMGVANAGAMRQWGTHAIAFLGKRHFDDPWLLHKLLLPLWE